MLTDVAEGLADKGEHILIITSAMTYDDPKVKLARREICKGVEIKRVRTTRFGRSNLVGRAADYMTFYLASFFCLLGTLRSSDILVIKTDPPLLSVPAGLAARLKSASTINWLQDIFPETAAELGVGFARKRAGRWLKALRDRSLFRARKTVVIGTRMEQRVFAMGVRKESVRLIPNFCDDTSITPIALHENTLRKEWGFTETDFVIGYSGNLGRAHDLSTMLGAAEALKDQPAYKFLFVGGGHLRSELDRYASEFALPNIVTKPYQPRSDLRRSLGVPNIHWASLRPSLEGLILPSKLYGIAASGRPLIMIGDPQGDIGYLAEQFQFGTTVPIGAVETLIAKLESYRSMPEQCEIMGRNARAFIDQAGARAHAIDAWRDLLDNVRSHPRMQEV